MQNEEQSSGGDISLYLNGEFALKFENPNKGAIETLTPTGPAETLQSLETNLLDHQDPQLIEEDASQFTPCDCGECFNCLADELSDQDQETCPECERYLTFCTCDPYCSEDYFDSEDEFGGEE